MGRSIDGGPRIGPPMPHQSVTKCPHARDKVTRLTPKTRQKRLRSSAGRTALDYRRPLKIGKIVRTRVNALVLAPTTRHPASWVRFANMGVVGFVLPKRASLALDAVGFVLPKSAP